MRRNQARQFVPSWKVPKKRYALRYDSCTISSASSWFFISQRVKLYASFISGSSRVSKRMRVCSSFMGDGYSTIEDTGFRWSLFPKLVFRAAGIISYLNRYCPDEGCATARPNPNQAEYKPLCQTSSNQIPTTTALTVEDFSNV